LQQSIAFWRGNVRPCSHRALSTIVDAPKSAISHEEYPLTATRFTRVLGLALILAVAACSTATTDAPSDALGDTLGGSQDLVITKSPNDDRNYRFVHLANALPVLLISDPDTDKAATSLTVFRGSFDEPADRNGLAHFLEHMLFLGTEAFPDVDEYRQFIERHGGGSNAYTASDHTNYFFDIKAEELEPALDRFAAFFTSPNFDAAYVDREKNAVNSEYQMQIKDDGWRGHIVVKQAMNPDYPGSRFTIGSLDTLDGDIRPELIAFFNANYSANQMALVVLGRENLDTLEAWAEARFSAIPNLDVGPSIAPGPMFAANRLPAQMSYRTIKETHSVSYGFPMPSIDRYYATKPTSYIANLLGHEGEGSLVANLKERGWIQSLAAGGGRFDSDNAMMTINIQLTEPGVDHIDEITAALFAYIELIRSQGIEGWRYQEQAVVARLGFQFQEQAKPSSYVRTLAPSMALYPPEDLLVAPYLMERFDEELINRFMGYLTPENVFIEIAGPDVDTNKVDPWFDVPYRLDATTPPRADAMELTLALPDVNRFLPKNTTVKALTQEKPRLLKHQPGLSVWGATDTSFGTPRASTYVELAVDGGFTEPQDLAYAHLFARLVRDELNAQAYAAELAGLGHSISANGIGFEIAVSGYNDNQHVLLDELLTTMAELEPDPDRVTLFTNELARDWRNFSSERPFLQTYSGINHLLLSTSWPPAMLADAANNMTPKGLAARRRDAHLRQRR
jgi:secreted Zn-dependent insulinase-like peptidase